MKTFLTILKWIGIIGLIGILIIAIAIQFINFSASPEEIESSFSNSEFKPVFKTVGVANNEIFYATVGDSTKPGVLFIHGSPGSWDNFMGLMADPVLQEKYYMISIDRPGFGNSGDGKPQRYLTTQASMAAAVLKQENKSAILVGHSYGGPVVVRMGIDSPELTEGIVIVAGSINPELEKTKWFQVPFDYAILSWILPGFLYSTNEEILALKKELEAMVPLWETIDQPVSVIQGGKDNLVPKENADFAKEMLVNASYLSMVEIPEMDHFVPWTRSDLIIQELDRIHEFLSDTSYSR